MVQVAGTEWDDELLRDRVDLYRKPRRQDISGVNRLDPVAGQVPELRDIPCSIQYAGSTITMSSMPSAQVLSDDILCFAEDIAARPDDTLVSRPPSLDGQSFRVGQYRQEQAGELTIFIARCRQVT